MKTKTKKALRRFLYNKRAVTPILSELMLTIIAVAAMSIATTATYVITTNMRDNMSERVVVEDVWFNSAAHRVDVYMHNVGMVDITVSRVYINHSSQTFGTPFQLETGSGDWLNVAFNWNSGDLYYIDIVTSRGTHIASYYKAT